LKDLFSGTFEAQLCNISINVRSFEFIINYNFERATFSRSIRTIPVLRNKTAVAYSYIKYLNNMFIIKNYIDKNDILTGDYDRDKSNISDDIYKTQPQMTKLNAHFYYYYK
jgi:hypothetical protein